MQISSRQFNQNVGQAQRAAQNEPVFITNRGIPTYVLLTKADYDRLIQSQPNLAELLACNDDVDLPIERANIHLREVEF
jgi:prevent-host-death family protein